MKHRATAPVGRIEKFEDRSRELFLNLKCSMPMNCQAPRTSQCYPSGEGQVENTGPVEITNNKKSSVH